MLKRFYLRFIISLQLLEQDERLAWEHIYRQFWRSPQATKLCAGPYLVQEWPYQPWEIEEGWVREDHKRFQIIHWGID